MKALILEDEESIAETLQYLLKLHFSELNEIIIISSVDEAISVYEKEHFDLLFLDVKLGKKTSFDFLHSVNALTTPKIFISGHESYMKAAFKENTVDFILKPIDTDELKITVTRAIEQVKKLSGTGKSFRELQEAKITIADLESIHLIRLFEINFLEADGPYTHLYMEDGSKLTFSKHLKEFEKKLNLSGFFRTHKSFIVNGTKVKSIQKKDGLQVVFHNGKSVPLSSRRKEEFFAFLKKSFEV